MDFLTHPGPEGATVAYLLDRDRRTRIQARRLYLSADQWPWGEALRNAREKHCAVLWTVGQLLPTAVVPVAVLPALVAPPASSIVPKQEQPSL